TVHETTIDQIKAAHEQFQFGRSGEFTLAIKEDEKIVFLMRNRMAGMDIPDPVSFEEQGRAEPMRMALSGQSGWMIGNDYRGVLVMAAYEPVQHLNLGIVAKMDMEDIRAPFIRASVIIISLAILVSLVTMIVFYKASRKISDKFEESTRQFNRLAKNSGDMIYRMSIPDGRYEYVNLASIDLFEVSPDEFYSTPKKIQELIHPAWQDYFVEQWGKLLAGDMPRTYEYQIVTPSGKTKWISQRNVLIRDEYDKPEAMEGIATDITDSKNSEIALRRSEEKFRALFEQAGGYCMILDPNTSDGIPVITEANEAAWLIHGYTREEFIGRPVADLDDEEGKQLVRSRTDEIMSGHPFYIENEHVRKDGSKFSVAVNAKRIDIGNDPPLILTTEFDITDRKHAEESLAENERRLRATFDQAAVGIARLSIDGEWLEVNDKLCEIVGYSREELLTKTFQDITYHEDLDGDLKLYQEALAGTRDNYAIDKRYIRKSGRLIWIRLSVALVRADDRTPLYFISVIEDINERKKAEEKLREAAAVFRSTGEGVTITDIDGVILDVNDAFTKITGYSRNEVIGENPRILKSGRHDDKFYSDMWGELLKYGHWHGEIWNRTKNGTIYPEMLTVNAVENEIGETTGYVGVFADISSLKSTEARLAHMAHHDPLTDLPNRMLFRDRLKHALAGAKRNNTKVAVIFLDLDHFKNVNDTLGHSVGDQLLIEIAQRMKMLIRTGDTVGRISGDEFCLLFEDLKSIADAVPLVEKLLSVFLSSFVVNEQALGISASIGVAVYPDNSKDTDALLSFADAAMYEAKDAGRNTYRFYTKAMTDQALEYSFVHSALREGLEKSQFFLVYQPQINLTTKELVGLEVLVRWQHPDRGLIPPSDFIPVAEQGGLIRELGAWILKTACEQGRSWLDKKLEFGRLFVNIAGQQIHDEGFVEQVRKTLSDTGLPVERLGLEVTESFVMRASDHATDYLLKLRDIGVELAIDDFGTGYSSLSYLKTLPIDKLKIDQSFVRDIPGDADDMAIAEAVIAMGRALKLKVIAEGVEDQIQAEFLLSKGCQEAQGYLYARPKTANDLKEWLIHTDEKEQIPII
ncbi:MAG: PAS domain S-box protein, partial [Candidatus Thiodiazotropha sp. 6PLUC3]